MSLSRNVLFRLGGSALLSLGVLTLTALPAASEEPAAKQQQVAEIERQIQELTKKLDALRKGEAAPSQGAVEGTLPAEWVKALAWRPIGPASMGGRIVALSVYDADPSTYWVATASGGLLKTINNGVTFEHQFDREATVSVGDVCVAPSDPNVVWVGTGENNPRNSVSYGDGVYKSTDGGKTWKNMGLKKTYQIGKVLVHPKDPNTVYAGALGRLYGPSEDRGLYKTTDGGNSWQKVLYVDNKTGVLDMRFKPDDPNTLLVATWERLRDGFDSHPGNDVPIVDGYDGYDPSKKWGPGSGIHKTTDGGKTFKKIVSGLPTNALGRIGLDWYRKNPNVVFAVVDCEKIGQGLPPVWVGTQAEKAEGGVKLTNVGGGGPAGKAGLKAGDVVTAVDKKLLPDADAYNELIESRKVGDKLTLTYRRDKETKDVAVTVEARPAGGQGFNFTLPSVYLGLQGEASEDRVRVSAVTADGPAAKAGIKGDDVLVTLDKKDVKELRNIADALSGHKVGDKVVARVLRAGKPLDLTVTLTARPATAPTLPTSRPYNYMYSGQQANVQHQQGPDSFQYGGLYKSTDAGDTWTRINSLNPRPMYFSQVRVDPSDDNYLYILGVSLHRSSNGGKKFTADGDRGVHPDQHALWVDPRDGRHMIVGCDGGFYATYDRMAHWDFLNHMAIGQFYHVAVDSRRPYRVYGGLQDNGSWGGPNLSQSGAGPINEDWIVVGGGDGFVCRVDASDPDLVYWESQDGMINRRNFRTGEFGFIRPRQQDGGRQYRFNWNTPFILSNHNPRLFYSAGNVVFRSFDRGSDLRVISPEITRTKRGSATALAESPRNPDVLWVGSDDGALWVTRDGGKAWTNVADKVGLKNPLWVATIEPSRGAEGRCYVAFDGHRADDDEPYIYVTEDYGQTWKSLRANLPTGSTRVLREDLKNPSLLYLGTEFGAWASVNRGASWTKINNTLPTVAVHEFAVHPTAGEVVVATHGRSLWVLDAAALRQVSADTIKEKAHLYAPGPGIHWRAEPSRGSVYGTGSRQFVGQNPTRGAQVYYSLTSKAEKISLKVVDYAGATAATLTSPAEPGLHRATWNLTRGQGGRAPAGTYRVVLSVDGQEQAQPVRVEDDPNTPPGLIASEAAEAPKAPAKREDF